MKIERKDILDLLGRGVDAWNTFRAEHPDWLPDLTGQRLTSLEARGIDFSRSNLSSADLSNSTLSDAKFRGSRLLGVRFHAATLTNATFREAELQSADFSGSFLHKARFVGANLRGVNLSGCDAQEALFVQANLEGALLNGSNFSRAQILGCRIWGLAGWDLTLEGSAQRGLIVTREHSENPSITVDDIEVAQFVHMLLRNVSLRRIIDAVATRAVLILGRFIPERKSILDATRKLLKEKGFVPIVFDFEGPQTRDTTETVSTLAHLSYFVIADITDIKSVAQELSQIIPQLPSVPVQPILQKGYTPYRMFEHFQRYPWVLDLFEYGNLNDLLSALSARLLDALERSARRLRKANDQEPYSREGGHG
jgi:uncharacterized protein YjbI with pentapeptide repeats